MDHKFLSGPRFMLPFDPGKIPAVLENSSFRKAAAESGEGMPLILALEAALFEEACVERSFPVEIRGLYAAATRAGG